MDKVLVLRLLIYGVITQVADKKHACGNTGTAASYRRPDGITIVCLPLPETSGDGESKQTLLNHGITLRVTPGDSVASHGLDRTKAKRDHSDLRHDITSTTANPIQHNHSKDKHQSELTSDHKGTQEAEKDDEEEEEEEEDPIEEKTHKRSVDSNSKEEPKHVPKKMERSVVRYNDADGDANSHSGTDGNHFEKVTIAKKDGAKKQTLTLANLHDMLGKDNDDEIEQYILIRRRKKPSQGERESNKGVMLPLSSTTMSTTETSTHHDTRKRRNSKLTQHKQIQAEHYSQPQTEDHADTSPKHKPTKRELNHSNSDQDQYDYGGKPGDHTQSNENPKKKKKKKKRSKKPIKSGKEENKTNIKKNKKEGKPSLEEDSDENHDHERKGKIDQKKNWNEVSSAPPPPSQIIIINMPVAHNGTISTTLAAPKPISSKHHEDNFNHFLRVFNFTPQNTHSSKDDSKDEKREKDKTKKKKRKKRKFENMTKRNDRNRRDKSDENKNKHKSTAGGNDHQPQQPETIYTLLLSKQINEERQHEPKEDQDHNDQSSDFHEPDKDLEYFMQQIPKSETPKKPQHSYRFGDRLTNPEKDSQNKPDHKPNKSNINNNNSNYKMVKITEVTLEHGNKSDHNQMEPISWPKKGKFHHEFNHSFEFKKKTESSHGDFEDFFNDNSEEEEDDEKRSTNSGKQDNSKQKVIWKMMKQVQSMPWLKPETHSEPRR